MESRLLNQIQQTTSRVKNVLEDSERLLAELKSRRNPSLPVVNQLTIEDQVDYNEGYADDEAEPEHEAEAEAEPEAESEPEPEPETQGSDDDEEEDEGYSTFFCCRTRRSVSNLLL